MKFFKKNALAIIVLCLCIIVVSVVLVNISKNKEDFSKNVNLIQPIQEQTSSVSNIKRRSQISFQELTEPAISPP